MDGNDDGKYDSICLYNYHTRCRGWLSHVLGDLFQTPSKIRRKSFYKYIIFFSRSHCSYFIYAPTGKGQIVREQVLPSNIIFRDESEHVVNTLLEIFSTTELQ